MTQIKVYPSKKALLKGAASVFIDLGKQAILHKGRFAVALSGGSTPLPLYQHLSENHSESRLEWELTHFFWGDERPVAENHPDSNYQQAYQTLLAPLGIPPRNIHRIRGELQPALAAEKYQQVLINWFGETPPVFDLILLGMGDDGHTASLFPGTEIISKAESVSSSWVKEVYVPQLKTWRISFTPQLIKAANCVIFLVTGKSKSDTLNNVLYGPYQPEVYPSQLFREDAIWLLDQDSSSKLPTRNN